MCITGGTVTAISIGTTSGALQGTGLTPGSFIVNPGEIIATTYSVAPTWQWFGV